MQEKWIVPCKISHFNVIEHFKSTDIVVWKNSFSIRKDDEVYIYLGKPYGEIKYKCVVIDDNVEESYLLEHQYAIVMKKNNVYFQKKEKYIKLKLITEYPDLYFKLEELKMNGLGQVQTQARVPRQLQPYILEKERKLMEE